MFYEKTNLNSKKIMFITIWEGNEYITNQNWTKITLKARVKTILQGLL